MVGRRLLALALTGGLATLFAVQSLSSRPHNLPPTPSEHPKPALTRRNPALEFASFDPSQTDPTAASSAKTPKPRLLVTTDTPRRPVGSRAPLVSTVLGTPPAVGGPKPTQALHPHSTGDPGDRGIQVNGEKTAKTASATATPSASPTVSIYPASSDAAKEAPSGNHNGTRVTQNGPGAIFESETAKKVANYVEAVREAVVSPQYELWTASLAVFLKGRAGEVESDLPESCGELTTASPAQSSTLVRLISFHRVFPTQYRGYLRDSADSLSRGNGNQNPHWRDGLFAEADTLRDADAIVYVASGDEISRSKPSILHDVATAQLSNLCIPVLFFLSSDRDYVPVNCSTTPLMFFSPATGPTPGATSRCQRFPLPYAAGTALPPSLKYEIPWAEFCPKLEESFRRERPLLATFVGSRNTYPNRELLRYLNESNRVAVHFTDEWWAEGTTEEERVAMADRAATLLGSSVFALCPRGVGPSSMRLAEAVGHGALPVLLDDWTTPFDDDMAGFAVRWPLLDPEGMSVLLDVLETLAADPKEIRRRQSRLRESVRPWHPFWYSAAYVRSKVGKRDTRCRPDLQRARQHIEAVPINELRASE